MLEYNWENPHTHIIVKVDPGTSDPSTVGTWDVEGGSVNIMTRQGWTKVSYRPGDPITVVGHMSAPRVALYKDTFPETTGTSRAAHAAEMPSIVRCSCQAPSGRSGLPRLRQSVIASEVAPSQRHFAY